MLTDTSILPCLAHLCVLQNTVSTLYPHLSKFFIRATFQCQRAAASRAKTKKVFIVLQFVCRGIIDKPLMFVTIKSM